MDYFKDQRKREYVNYASSNAELKNPINEQTVKTARAWRKSRLIQSLKQHDCDAILLFDPVNIRYALDSSNMNVWALHNQFHYALVFADGYAVDFAFPNSEHLSSRLETVNEVRQSISWFFFAAGGTGPERASKWGDEIVDLLREHGASRSRVAVDKIDPMGLDALRARGINPIEGQRVVELARCIKNDAELQIMDWTIKVAESGMRRMYEASVPGKTEQEIWAELHFENIRWGGEWIETRLCTAGPRTNPWWSECSDYVCQEGDMLAFDTDMIGPYGYCADLSRSWTIGHVPMDGQQQELYSVALEQIEHNVSILKPGLSFSEFNDLSWKLPDKYVANRYSAAIHGIGLADEYPNIPPHPDFDPGYDGIFEENMVVCAEALIGEEGGRECVKLETQVVIGPTGATRLDTFPFVEVRGPLVL
ncbi:Xaa-Pro peptidase family protein [Pseudarthrobacter sp. HLT1-5]|nr:Xaa-Pro peptidase family protein [Pseudarthrobacter sp. HLT1-5]